MVKQCHFCGGTGKLKYLYRTKEIIKLYQDGTLRPNEGVFACPDCIDRLEKEDEENNYSVDRE